MVMLNELMGTLCEELGMRFEVVGMLFEAVGMLFEVKFNQSQQFVGCFNPIFISLYIFGKICFNFECLYY